MKKFMILLFTLMVAIDGYSQTRVICGTCNGYKRLLCPNCGGAGYVLQPYYNPYYGWMQQNVPCGRCGGYGSLVCGNCRGSGVVIVNNRYSGPTFRGDATPPNSSTDGYIYQGRSVKYKGNSYRLYRKSGHSYIYDSHDGWIRLD